MKIKSHFAFKEINDSLLITNEVGDFDFFKKGFLKDLFSDNYSYEEENKLKKLSVFIEDKEEWKYSSLARRVYSKYAPNERRLNYFILIPTLRCNLSCSYCQVSRAPEKAKGFDWTKKELILFERFVQESNLDHVKIEFQGGEPTLRLDLIQEIIDIVKRNSQSSEFVICTNMVNLNASFLKILERENLSISTSIDGTISSMSQNRTFDDDISKKIFLNFQKILKTFGPEKISALPTVTENQIDHPKELINTYKELGFNSIFLRPVNYMGFARKKHKESSNAIDEWNNFYLKSLDEIKKINKSQYFEEFYLASLVKEIFTSFKTGFVDYKSPSRFLDNYVVIDYDGSLFISDEARMLSRTNHVDLSIGSLEFGLDENKLKEINYWSENQTHQDCIHCVYQPFCGIDIVDDMSRYKRFDGVKLESWFCNRQTFLFDFIFDKIEKKDPEWLKVFSNWITRSKQSEGLISLFT